ncbi:hypothetical protein GCM10010250_21920 [Streptomyces althioticus]|uniref:hypothetical protein n=1 Tax=Streptomyces althioticus TaxID=83380 RepID=UPI0019876DCC|nr:hypothetical protein GCM10010250_21920 [Streptomyces althioticus]
MTTHPNVTDDDLAAALDNVARILDARAQVGRRPILDHRVLLQVAAGQPTTVSFDRTAWAEAWRAARADGTRPHRRALYQRLRAILDDEFDDEADAWEGRPREGAAVRRIASRLRTVDTRVCIGSSLGPFDAQVDPADRWHGSVSPRFTLDTVRELAAELERQAEHPDFVDDTVHVIDRGRTDRDGQPVAVVLVVSWRYLSDEGPEHAVRAIEPDADGRYPVGAWEWCWSFATWQCLCGAEPDWHVTTCPHCGRNRDKAAALNDSSRQLGGILRPLAPEATSALIDIHDGRAHVIAVHAGDDEIDTADDGGVYDTETLGAADALLQSVIDGTTADDLAAAPDWQHTPDDESAHAWRITFPAQTDH